MRSLQIIALALALFVGPFSASAQTEPEALDSEEQQPDHARSGPYLGIAFSVGFEDFSGLGGINVERETSRTPSTIKATPGASPGFSVKGGYRLWERFAFELMYEYLPAYDVTVEIDGIAVAPQAFTIETAYLGASAKFFILTGSVQPYVIGGIGYSRFVTPTDINPPSDNGFATRWGGGIDYHFNEHFSGGLEGAFVVNTGATEGFNYWSIQLGSQYRF